MDSKFVILIAEDSEEDALIVQHCLKRAGLPNPTHICRDGEEVIRYLNGSGAYADRQKYPFPRMLILDLKMPRLGGFDVLRWVRKNPSCAVIPTLILSSSNLPRDVQEAYELGANAYLMKRGNLTEIQDMFISLHGFWRFCEVPESPGR